jgi:hypothetical protein
MNTSSSAILRSTILRFTDRILELTLRMVLYVSSELSRLQRTLLIHTVFNSMLSTII